MKSSDIYIGVEKKLREELIGEILGQINKDESYQPKRELTYEIVDDQFNVNISSVNKEGIVTTSYMGDEDEISITELTFNQLVGILKDMEESEVKTIKLNG